MERPVMWDCPACAGTGEVTEEAYDQITSALASWEWPPEEGDEA